MFTIRYQTDSIVPGDVVVLRASADDWADFRGEYDGQAWVFELDESRFPAEFQFKFAVLPDRWMRYGNLVAGPVAAGDVLTYTDAQVTFPFLDPITIENGKVARTLVRRDLRSDTTHDVIVVGSGMGGGVLASALADAGHRVLVLEAGSLLFPTHVGNLARRLMIGGFQKHVWSLWQDFGVINYTNRDGSRYSGAQAFNLGGRSLFWGSLIPEAAPWQLQAWPAGVRRYLLDEGGYRQARTTLNAHQAPVTEFQQKSREYLDQVLPAWSASDAPVGVQYLGKTMWSLPAGIFSTADLLLEDQLAQLPPDGQGDGRTPLAINLNHYVQRVLVDPANPRRVIGVRCLDLSTRREVTYRADTVVLSGGTIESAKIALRSGLEDPAQKIGRGITDHLIRYRHFVAPPAQAHASPTDSAKVLLQHPDATTDQHAFDIVVELGSEFNQGRYVDPAHLQADINLRKGYMLCEIVFQYYSPLLDDNAVTVAAGPVDSRTPVDVYMTAAQPAPSLLREADDLARDVLGAFTAEPVFDEGPGLELQPALVGGVAHEVGTLRMADDGNGVVDENLKFLAYDNLYACDNSVFPVSPAANPSLTLVALALRLARHLGS
jgi:choline dehydrogenase-like flavoprotein